MHYRFGDYELNVQLYQLRHAGELVEIEPKVFDLLVYLIEHHERAVSKDELLDKLWPDQVVSETALTQCVMAARKAVGDDGARQYTIKTQHGRGCRFVAPVTAVAAPVQSSTFQVPGQEEGGSSQQPVVSTQAPTANGQMQEVLSLAALTDDPAHSSPLPIRLRILFQDWFEALTTSEAPKKDMRIDDVEIRHLQIFQIPE